MDLSIIIPVLNESKKIRNDILAVSQFLSENKIEGEIIVVDDGSNDDTIDVAKNVEVDSKVSLHVLNQKNHRGKGFAVKTGVLKSIGKFVLFIDSGLCVSLEHILTGLKTLQDKNCDIAHGSRFLRESIIIRPHLRSRRISSALFRRLFKTLFNIPSELTDTQCGFKIYKGEVARKLYADCFTDGFMFDIETILRAKKNNFRIKEFPIEWKADLDSRLSQVRMPFNVFLELVRIKRAIKNT